MATHRQAPEPVLWLRPNGGITVEGQLFNPQISPGTRALRTNQGVVYDFAGPKSGILFPDLPKVRLNGSITVSAWINPRSYVNDGPGAQLLFRGDDRNGIDPYDLVIHSNGTVNFFVTAEDCDNRCLTADLPLGRWTHVLGNLNVDTGEMELWINGELSAMTKTKIRPMVGLESGWAPGIGIGNVQNDKGPHNQPFNGQIADMRLYRVALRPDDLGGTRRTDDVPPLKSLMSFLGPQ